MQRSDVLNSSNNIELLLMLSSQLKPSAAVQEMYQIYIFYIV